MKRGHAEPARVGVVLLNAQLTPLHYNAEAASILGYPETLRKAPSLNDVLPPDARAELANRSTPAEIEFRSGRRRYLCRTFLLDSKRKAEPRFQPKVVVMLERDSTHVVDVTQWSEDHQLTSRERETVTLLMKGLTSKQIAEHMNISPNTVKSFLKLVMIKVGASNRTGIIAKLFDRAS